MRKALCFAIAVILTAAVVPFAALAAFQVPDNNPVAIGNLNDDDQTDGDYLPERVGEGIVDVLSGCEGQLYCAPTSVRNNINIGNLLTDGLIAARQAAPGEAELTNCYLNCKAADAGAAATVEVPGVDEKYVYLVHFGNLKNVTADSASVYYASQAGADSARSGVEPVIGITDTNVVILVSVDRGFTYEVAYRTSDSAAFSEEVTQMITYADPETFNVYWYRTANFKFDKTYTGVTDIIYAAPTPRHSDNGYTARISEFSVYGASAANPELTNYAAATRPEPTTEEITTAAPPPDTQVEETPADSETEATPDTDKSTEVPDESKATEAPGTTAPPANEKGCSSAVGIGICVAAVLAAGIAIRKKD